MIILLLPRSPRRKISFVQIFQIPNDSMEHFQHNNSHSKPLITDQNQQIIQHCLHRNTPGTLPVQLHTQAVAWYGI